MVIQYVFISQRTRNPRQALPDLRVKPRPQHLQQSRMAHRPKPRASAAPDRVWPPLELTPPPPPSPPAPHLPVRDPALPWQPRAEVNRRRVVATSASPTPWRPSSLGRWKVDESGCEVMSIGRVGRSVASGTESHYYDGWVGAGEWGTEWWWRRCGAWIWVV